MKQLIRLLKCIAILLFCIQLSVYSPFPSKTIMVMPFIGLIAVILAISTKDPPAE